MFKITEIEIEGFWGRFTASSDFNESVNIIIGKNGTGKTTFMNVLHAVLGVDPDGLYDNEFTAVKIRLADGKKIRTITATKDDSDARPFPVVTYYISNNKYVLPLVNADEPRSFAPSHRRRTLEESSKIRQILSSLYFLTSLSVYRLRQDPDLDGRDRSRRQQTPVDGRLQELMQKLTQYQFELSMEARKISAELQKNVLISLLYAEKQVLENRYTLSFDADEEKRSLVSAYKQLGLNSPEISAQIQEHITAVGKTIKALKNNSDKLDFAPLEARARTSQVIELSLDAEKKTAVVFSQVQGFLKTLETFIPNKKFQFEAGELVVKGETPIPLPKLSSGEKQLLILFIETLLQKQLPYIFLADEPELSLHISWQREIISAITKLNPKAQIIVATHSPEIAGKFSKNIIDMEDILHG